MYRNEVHSRRYLDTLFQELVNQDVQQILSIVYSVSKLSQDPHHARLGLGLLKHIKGLTQSRDDALVFPRVPPEDVFDDDDGFLDDVSDLGLNERQERLDADICGWFDFDGDSTDGTDGFAHEIDVDFGCVSMALINERTGDWEGNLLLQLR
jgi:hypothetical protein